MKKIDVTVSLVHYKTPALLISCLRSLIKYTKGITYEIIIVDNAPVAADLKKIKKEFSGVTIIANKENTWATGGNNQAFRLAKGKYFLVLNPDMEFSGNVLKQMTDFLDTHSDVAAISCKQLWPNGKTHMTCSKFPTPMTELWESNIVGQFFQNKKALADYRYADWNRKTDRIVEVIPDTIMMIRMDVAKKLDMYDEHIKLMFMEHDVCQRIKQLGYKVCHVGAISIVHYTGESTKTMPSKMLYEIFQQDRLYYFEKYYGKNWRVFLQITFLLNKLYFFLEPLILRLRRRARKKDTRLTIHEE